MQFIKNLIANIPMVIGFSFNFLSVQIAKIGMYFVNLGVTSHIKLGTKFGKELKIIQDKFMKAYSALEKMASAAEASKNKNPLETALAKSTVKTHLTPDDKKMANIYRLDGKNKPKLEN